MQATGVLYQSVWNAISEIAWSSNVTKQKAIAFVEFLNRKRHMENTDPLEYTDLACKYFIKKIGGHYRSITKPLLDAGILQSNKYYRPGYYNDDEYIKGQCLSYRINPDLLDDEIIKINYKGEKSKQRCRDATTMKSKQIMRQVRIPDLSSRELIKFVKKSLSDERIRAMLKVNDEIDDCQVHIKGRNHPIAIETVQRRTKDLIKDGKYCHIEHLETYIKRKRRHLTQAYCDQLLRIKHRNIYADRNETNLRLDSNLTNLKSQFMSLLSIDGHRLSQVDLKNSQFRVFVYLLEQVEREILFSKAKSAKYYSEFNLAETAKSGNTQIKKEGKEIRGKPITLLSSTFEKYVVSREGLMVSVSKDYKLFKKLVKTGQLYEHIQKLIWKETGRTISRKEAKKIMFTIAFSSYRYQPEEKQVVRKYFPSVVGVIDGFKKGAIAELANEGIGELANDHPLNPPQGGQKGQEVGRPLAQGGISTTLDVTKGGDVTKEEDDGRRTTAAARKEGNASFAILLQQVESLIFIDEILAKCHKAGIKALSKHDSIVCRQCDKHKVTKIVCKVLNSLFGRYTYALDIDGDLFDLKPKRKSRLGRVATTLFSQLKVGMNWGNGPPPKAECGPLCPTDISPKGEKLESVGISELVNEGQDISTALPPEDGQADVTRGTESILSRERVKSGDTAAVIMERLGNGMDAGVSEERQRHRYALEEFKRKLRDRRKRSVGRSRERDGW